jgi:hypothetical protein
LLSACGGGSGDNPRARQGVKVAEGDTPARGLKEAQHLTNQARAEAETGSGRANAGERPSGDCAAEGVTLRGSVTASRHDLSQIRVTLVRQIVVGRNSPAAVTVLAYAAACVNPVETLTAADGSFRLESVRPGAYTLVIAGKSVAPARRTIVVGSQDLRLQPIPLEGTGRIRGELNDYPDAPSGNEPHPFARAYGSLQRENFDGIKNAWSSTPNKAIPFRTDDRGRFSIEDLPAGRFMLSFMFRGSKSGFYRQVQIEEGKTTEVRLFDPTDRWKVPLEITLGNGQTWTSDSIEGPHLHIRIEARTTDPVSYGCDHRDMFSDFRGKIVLPDASPGQYRLSVFDEVSHNRFVGPLQAVDVDTRRLLPPVPIRLEPSVVRLRAGVSSTDRGSLFLVRAGADAPIETDYCPCETLTLSNLPLGKYSVFLLLGDRFSRQEGVDVTGRRPAEIGMPALQRSGAIAGRIRLGPGMWPRPTAIAVRDSHGVALPVRNFEGYVDEEFALSGLWPGCWTVTFYSGTKAFAVCKLTLQGAETVRCDLGPSLSLVKGPPGQEAGR